jgi:peptide/nickel transport system substrate-binding protein
MAMKRRDISLVLVILTVLASLLAACGQPAEEGTEEVAPETTELPTEAPTEAPTEVPTESVEDEGGEEPEGAAANVVVAQGVDPASLDPQVGESGPKINVLIHMLDTVFAINDDMEVVPQVAESWEVLNDNLTWRIKLREDVTFWNGEPLDAEAVKYTIDRTVNEDLIAQGLNDPFPSRVKLVSAEVVDDYTIDINTETPQPLMPLRLTYLFILEPTHYESISFEDASINPMGSGAYKFVEWVKDDHVTMVRNPDWWGGEAEIGKLTFRAISESAVRFSELETGGAHLITDVKPEDLDRVESMPHAHVSWINGGRRIFIGFNMDKEYFQEPEVRQAFNYAVDWSEISEGLFAGMGGERLTSVAAGWLPEDLEPYPYDPEKAQSMLDEAGFPMDQKLTLNTPNGRYLKDVEIGQAVAGQLGEIGIEVEVVPLEWSVMLDNIHNRTMEDLFLLGLGSRFIGLQDLDSLRPDGTFNAGGWVNEDYLAAREKANSYMAVEEQKPHVQDAIRAAYQDPPWIFLYNQLSMYGVDDMLAGWQARPDERIRLDHLELGP